MKMKVLNVGLVKGRHNLPVEFYVYNEIKDVLDFDALLLGAIKFFKEHSNNNQIEYNLYITGLTPATIAVIRAFSLTANEGDRLTFYHYDREADSFKKQYGFVVGFDSKFNFTYLI